MGSFRPTVGAGATKLKIHPSHGHSVDRARREYATLIERRLEIGMTAIIAGKLPHLAGWNHQKPERREVERDAAAIRHLH
jgi:hypothetical protein